MGPLVAAIFVMLLFSDPRVFVTCQIVSRHEGVAPGGCHSRNRRRFGTFVFRIAGAVEGVENGERGFGEQNGMEKRAEWRVESGWSGECGVESGVSSSYVLRTVSFLSESRGASLLQVRGVIRFWGKPNSIITQKKPVQDPLTTRLLVGSGTQQSSRR